MNVHQALREDAKPAVHWSVSCLAASSTALETDVVKGQLGAALVIACGCLPWGDICCAQAVDGMVGSGTPVFQIQFSEPLAVLNFVASLSPNAPENALRQVFSASRFNTDPYKALVAEAAALNIDYAYDFPEYARTGKRNGSTEFLLRANLIKSRRLDEFRIRSLGIVPNEVLFRLTAILKEFTPVYQELVYQPHREAFEEQLADFKALVAATDMTSYFRVGTRFYNSSWDDAVPFNIVLYPLPASRGFTATAYANNAESGIPTGFRDYKGLLGVIFHEICHVLYDEESLAFKKEIARWSDSNPSKSRHYALGLLLNESLATALGNGYVFGRLNGRMNEGNWYGRKQISQMAKKIYPLVVGYIENQKPIDRAFIDSYIRIFDETFSDWLFDPDHVMADRYVLSDDSGAFGAIDRRFPYSPMAERREGISECAVEAMARSETTKVIVISKDNKRKLELVRRAFPELKDWKPNAETDFTYPVLLKDGTYLIVVNSVGATTGRQLETLKLKD